MEDPEHIFQLIVRLCTAPTFPYIWNASLVFVSKCALKLHLLYIPNIALFHKIPGG